MNTISRRALFAATAAVATGLGAGFGWQRWRPQAAAPDAADQFWTQSFHTADGALTPVAGWRGQPTLVNFWATWCPPCVEEMPMLDSFYAQHAGRCHVLGLAIDQAAAVRSFLNKQSIRYPILLAGTQGLALTKVMGNEGGGLPFSVFLNASGAISHAKVGKLHESDLTEWIKRWG